MRSIGIIPARFESSRFPGKPLAQILGKPMICWVAEGAMQSGLLDDVIVTSDNDRILDAVRSRGFHAVQSSAQHQTGSDRAWEIASHLDAEIIVNIQGDEPAVGEKEIDACIRPLLTRKDVDVVTLKIPITEEEDLNDPNLVKVVTDLEGFALYFSRAAIPYHKPVAGEFKGALHFGHVGIYAYTRSALETFANLPQSDLEKQESLEQLRGLSAGLSYLVIESDYKPIKVDTKSELVKAERFLRNRLECE